jgi:hypothetical protein
MTDLIKIQLITSSVILVTFALVLRFRLLRKTFRSLEFEEGLFTVLHGILGTIMLYLTFLIVRDLWQVLR